MEHKPSAHTFPARYFELFRVFVAQGKIVKGEGEPGTRFRASVLALPLDGAGAGRPVNAIVTGLEGNQIHLEYPFAAKAGERFSLRLETSSQEASWVECLVITVKNDLRGYNNVQAEFMKVSCDHAHSCPAYVYMTTGKLTGCSHVGHDGCHQTGPVGAQLKKNLGA